MKIKDYTEEQINEVFDEHKSVFYVEQETEEEPEAAEEEKKKAKKKKVTDQTAVKAGEQPVSQIKENEESMRSVKSADLCEACRSKIFG